MLSNMWIAYATSTSEYTPIAAVTSREAQAAVERLLGPVRWWYYEDLGHWWDYE